MLNTTWYYASFVYDAETGLLKLYVMTPGEAAEYFTSGTCGGPVDTINTGQGTHTT